MKPDNSSIKYTAKAGRFRYDHETKKVRVSKEKGLLSVYISGDQTHFSWANLETNIEQIYIYVFPFDSIFEQVPNQNNTFVLRFQSNEDKYFFWLQEKILPEEFVKEVNRIIAIVPSEIMEVEASQQSIPDERPAEVDQSKVDRPTQPTQTTSAPMQEFIKRMQDNLMNARKQTKHVPQNPIELKTIMTQDCITALLSSCSEEQIKQLVDYLPEEQKQSNYLETNMRSMQFLQAVDVLNDALNSQNSVSLFLQMGLDTSFLKTQYGVNAFLTALRKWAQK